MIIVKSVVNKTMAFNCRRAMQYRYHILQGIKDCYKYKPPMVSKQQCAAVLVCLKDLKKTIKVEI